MSRSTKYTSLYMSRATKYTCLGLLNSPNKLVRLNYKPMCCIPVMKTNATFCKSLDLCALDEVGIYLTIQYTYLWMTTNILTNVVLVWYRVRVFPPYKSLHLTTSGRRNREQWLIDWWRA